MEIKDLNLMCDICLEQAVVSITLENGELFQVCKECIPVCIQTEASTNNPVHSIEEIEL